MATNTYIAVTIGPIFDTVNLASSPSALWAASYLFSMLSKNICQTLTENGVAKESIISPFYDSEDELLNKNDGVGLFHDRIIFRADDFSIEDFNDKIKDEAIKKTLVLFRFKEGEREYFKKYFLVSAFVFESDSPILDSAKVLDSLELAKPFAEERGSNPLLTLYTSNDTAHKNQQITMLVNNMGIRQWQLFDSNHTIMSLSQIAKNRVPAKTAENHKNVPEAPTRFRDVFFVSRVFSPLSPETAPRPPSGRSSSRCSGRGRSAARSGRLPSSRSRS